MKRTLSVGDAATTERCMKRPRLAPAEPLTPVCRKRPRSDDDDGPALKRQRTRADPDLVERLAAYARYLFFNAFLGELHLERCEKNAGPLPSASVY